MMSDERTTVAELSRLVDQFVAQRHWQPFHTPKNLAMALAIEAAELMEHFQWLDNAESVSLAEDATRRAAVGEELADVASYLLAMATAMKIDLAQAIVDKMAKNAQKYPVEEYRGRWGPLDPSPPESESDEG
jgi:NTP pyrophosphatase (non-canonical NTP hydrolase)